MNIFLQFFQKGILTDFHQIFSYAYFDHVLDKEYGNTLLHFLPKKIH